MAAINEQTLTTDQSSVFFLSGHSETHLPSVTRSIQKLMPDQPSEFTYIGTARSYECAPSPVIKSPSQLLVELYRRRLKPLGTGGNTILSAESQMAILQLCLAEHNKQVWICRNRHLSLNIGKGKRSNKQSVSQTVHVLYNFTPSALHFALQGAKQFPSGKRHFKEANINLYLWTLQRAAQQKHCGCHELFRDLLPILCCRHHTFLLFLIKSY